MSEIREETEDKIQNGDDRQLLRQFRGAARIADRFEELLKRVNTLTNALRIQTSALEDEKAKTRRLERELAEARGETPQEKPLAILIDGSANMLAPPGSGVKSPLEVALEATFRLLESGVNARTNFWGGCLLPFEMRAGPVEMRPGADIIGITQRAIERAPRIGAAFAPVVDFMESPDPWDLKNFVIISDGAFYDSGVTLSRTLEMLGKHPETTLDFVLIDNQRTTEMERFAQSLIRSCPNSRQVMIMHAGTAGEVTAALKDIAAYRTAQLELEKQAVQPAYKTAQYRHG